MSQKKNIITLSGEESTNTYLEVTARFGAEEFELDLVELKILFPQLDQMEEIDNIWEAYREITDYEHTYNMLHWMQWFVTLTRMRWMIM